MYKQFFGLTKRPFILTPDPEFLYVSRAHDLALTHLEYGLAHHVGFMALTGEVGAGKTTLLKHMLNQARSRLDIAMIFNTNLDPTTLLQMLCREFGLEPQQQSRTDLFDALFHHFMKQFGAGNRCVILVDEAQNLPLETFEELRMLSNLEADSDFLVQIILVGQPQLRERLAHPGLTQLAQRISVYYHLLPLDNGEVDAYIRHRLDVAGYDRPAPLFASEAVERVAAASKGIPRIINSICDAALTYAYAEDRATIDSSIVELVLADNEMLRSSSTSEADPSSYADQDRLADLSDTADPVAVAAQSLTAARAAAADLASATEAWTPAPSNGRLDALEMRVKFLETRQNDRAVAVLREMLNEERDRNLRLEQNVAQLKNMCRTLQTKLKRAEELFDEKPVQESKRRRWFSSRS